MRRVEAISQLDLAQIETLVLAGGGNRCWWQAGALSHLFERSWSLPVQLVGTSAGAAVAAACITQGLRTALTACLRLYSTNERIFDWRGLKRLNLRFAHQHIYPAWIESFINTDTFVTLRSSRTRLRVALARPGRILGLAGSVVAGTLAYLVDKKVSRSLHPRLPGLLGLRQDFVDVHRCNDIAEVQALLAAAAAAPPFMHSVRIGGGPAIDAGYADSASIHEQSPAERLKTLVLLTRHYPRLPRFFRCDERLYWQPSKRVPVSTWDCTRRTDVQVAFALGEQDAALAANSGVLCI